MPHEAKYEPEQGREAGYLPLTLRPCAKCGTICPESEMVNEKCPDCSTICDICGESFQRHEDDLNDGNVCEKCAEDQSK